MNIITKVLLSQVIMLCACCNVYSMENINNMKENDTTSEHESS